jgi:AraC-like DNA-binding protein
MDPLSQFLALLRPRGFSWKQGELHGDWALQFPSSAGLAFCLVRAGTCRLDLPKAPTRPLQEGDFLLLPAPPAWTLSNGDPVAAVRMEDALADRDLYAASARVGASSNLTQLVGGHFSFDEINMGLLNSLMPPVVIIGADASNAPRLHGVLNHIAEETASDRPGRELVLNRLLEIMLVEAIRHSAGPFGIAHQGLLAGLGDQQVAVALRAMHADVRHDWTVSKLAAVAGGSRSAFAERFTRVVGTSPMNYLLQWRMALAKDALQLKDARVEQVAFACGYNSSSAFSTAFTRTVGCPPARYAARSTAVGMVPELRQ